MLITFGTIISLTYFKWRNGNLSADYLQTATVYLERELTLMNPLTFLHVFSLVSLQIIQEISFF